MDSILVSASILLALTNLSFALLALSWKRKATKAALQSMIDAERARKDSFADGYAQASKVAAGGMYLAALRVDADDRVLQALRVAGRRLLGEDS